MRLQTILKPDKAICNEQELYFHEKDGSLFVDGFFNMFYIEKHKYYTDLDKLRLKLSLRGWSEIILMHDKSELATHTLEAAAIREYEFELPYAEFDNGVFWFKLREGQSDSSSGLNSNLGSDTVSSQGSGTSSNQGSDSDTVSGQGLDSSSRLCSDSSIDLSSRLSSGAGDSSDNITCSAPDRLIEGYYEGSSAAAERTVNIAVDICTYRREEYVLRNMQSLCENIYHDESKEVRRHLTVMLIDNGHTIAEHEELSKLIEREPDLKLFTNKNAGGAGGFTRGMLEIIRSNEISGQSDQTDTVGAYTDSRTGLSGTTAYGQAESSRHSTAGTAEKTNAFTHVLIMDDDAVFDPDVFVRLYGFLSMLKEEYKDITVGGALMREDMPYCQAVSGEYYEGGMACNPYPMKDMREYDNCVSSHMCEPYIRKNAYSGWWCCCFSINTVNKDNLPLPIFIHCDDIEYGIRNQDKGIVFLNGICVWHKSADQNVPGANRYYDIRNKLITLCLHDELTKSRAVKTVLRAMAASYISGRDSETLLAYRGGADYCKGSDFLLNTEPEQLNVEIRAIAKEYTKSSRLREMFKLLSLMSKTVNDFNKGFDKASSDYRQNYRTISSYDSWCRYLGVK